MEGKRHDGSLEEILREVEADETLREGEKTETQDMGQVFSAAPSDTGTSDEKTGIFGNYPGSAEIMNKLPAILQMMKTFSELASDGKEKKENGGGRGERPRSPVNLLNALRPYLSESRRRAVDTMIRISKLSDSLQTLK